MSSTISTTVPAELLIGNPSNFHTVFTPWENLEPFFDQPPCPSSVNNQQSVPNLTRYHADDSDERNPNSPKSSSVSATGSDEPNRNYAGLGLDDPVRKLKRKISNRESAKRSRMKKQRRLQNLRDQVNQLITKKQERMNLLRFVNHHLRVIRNDNTRFKGEVNILRWKLTEFNQILRLQQLQQRAHLTLINNPYRYC